MYVCEGSVPCDVFAVKELAAKLPGSCHPTRVCEGSVPCDVFAVKELAAKLPGSCHPTCVCEGSDPREVFAGCSKYAGYYRE